MTILVTFLDTFWRAAVGTERPKSDRYVVKIICSVISYFCAVTDNSLKWLFLKHFWALFGGPRWTPDGQISSPRRRLNYYIYNVLDDLGVSARLAAKQKSTIIIVNLTIFNVCRIRLRTLSMRRNSSLSPHACVCFRTSSMRFQGFCRADCVFLADPVCTESDKTTKDQVKL